MSMSNRARRMVQHQMRNRAMGELNLIPMIDILSVMVSFLLVYSTEVEVVQNPKGIEIPQSIAEERPRQTVVVMLTKQDLFVQGERVASVDEVRNSPSDIVAALSAALKRPSLSDSAGTGNADREVTVMADKSLPYEVVKRIMRTCTDADYSHISLAVLQADKPVSAAALKRS